MAEETISVQPSATSAFQPLDGAADDWQEEQEAQPPVRRRPDKRRGPKRPLQRGDDGMSTRPAGRAPEGTVWHPASGEWVDDGQEEAYDDDDDDDAPVASGEL